MIDFEYWNLVPNAHLDVSFQLINEYGVIVFNPTTFFSVILARAPVSGGPFPLDLSHPGRFAE